MRRAWSESSGSRCGARCSAKPVERSRHPVLLYALVLLMVLSWSFNFIAGKIALRHMDPWTLATFRIILSAVLTLPFYFAMPRRTRFHRHDLWTFTVLGFFGVVVNRGFFTFGLAYTTVGHSAMIVATGPILVLLLARAFRLENITPAKIAGMALSFAGVGVLVSEGGLHFHSGTLTGDLVTLGGTIGFAVYTVLGKRVARQYDTISMNTFNNLAGAVILLPLGVWRALHLDWAGVGWAGWSAVVYMALVTSVLAYLIFFWALRHMAASRLSAFSYLHPPLATLLGVLLLGEKLTRLLLIGGALILAGVYLTEFGAGSEKAPLDTAAA